MVNLTYQALQVKMDKRYKHLPSKHMSKLMNALQFLNLVAFGFVASQPVFYLMALDKIQKGLSKRSKIKLGNFPDKQPHATMLGYYLFIVTSYTLLTFVSGK